MLKLLFSLFLGLILGWTLHYLSRDDFNQEKSITPIITKPDCTDSEEITERTIIQKVIQYVPKTKIIYKTQKIEKQDDNKSKDLFFIALEKREFDSAMEYYQDADEEKYPSYRSALYAYFDKMKLKFPIKTIEEIQTFIEIEPENTLFIFQLSKLYEKRGEYNLALNLLVDLSYVISVNEKKSIDIRIKNISKSYIERLTKAEEFKVLIDFLMTRIDIGILSEFYSYELAKVYLKLKKYYKSIDLLQELKENDLYKERALALLNYLQLKLEEQEEYPIQIPLIRHGLHFLVNATVDDTAVTLMVDTGASITTIDVNKIQHLPIIRENALFHTAGGKIYENIHEAKEFKVGSKTITNFNISASHFTGSSSDGLLGMNFLGKFKFKIDQQEAILYLGKKGR